MSGRVRCAAFLLSVAVVLLSVGPGLAFAADIEVPAPVADAVSAALVAWAEFATSGDTSGIDAAFVIGGPQHRQLKAESSTQADTPEALLFTVLENRLRRLGFERATVWVRVQADRVGFESQTFSWDFDLIRRDGRWKVWTVLSADRPKAAQDVWHESLSTSTTATTTAALSPEPVEPEYSAAPHVDSAAPRRGVRLPALSAWVIVITIVGVALAGYLAPRLDRGRER